MKNNLFFITTAIEETWPSEDKPVLFLGEWCKLYERKDRWSRMNAEVLSYHWDDRSKLHSDYLYMNKLYEKTLFALSIHLNLTHNVDHSARYWRILAGPWLGYFIHIMMDRWLSIHSAINNYWIGETVILTGIEDDLVPNDMNQFTSFFEGDIWNHLIYSEIVKYGNYIQFAEKEYRRQTAGSGLAQPSSGNRVYRQYSKFAKHFVRNQDAFIKSSYLGTLDEVMLNLKIGQFPQFWEDIQPVEASLRWQQRAWRLDLEAANEFERFLLTMIPRQIPKVFLEGYDLLRGQVENLPWPESPRIIYTSNVLWHDTVSMAYTATKVDHGSSLVYGQHGGVYGTAKFSFAEEHEIKISERYLTWGWGSASNGSVIPVGINKVVKRPKINWNNNDCLLLVTLNVPRYSYRLCSESAINFTGYLEGTFSFAEHLTDTLKNNLLIRLTPWDKGWCVSFRWMDRFPNVRLDYGYKRIYGLMKKSRLVVLTYNQTGFLEALFMRIPSILFCNLEKTPLRESAIPFYAELKRVGIFHDTPESAAAHVNKVWYDVNTWWLDPDVQNVLTGFTNHYCRKPNNIVGQIRTVFQSLGCDQ